MPHHQNENCYQLCARGRLIRSPRVNQKKMSGAAVAENPFKTPSLAVRLYETIRIVRRECRSL